MRSIFQHSPAKITLAPTSQEDRDLLVKKFGLVADGDAILLCRQNSPTEDVPDDFTIVGIPSRAAVEKHLSHEVEIKEPAKPREAEIKEPVKPRKLSNKEDK